MKSNIFKTWKRDHKTKIITAMFICQEKKNGLRIDKMNQLISKENFEVVEKDQDLQQVVELKLEDTICQKFDDEVEEIKEVLVNCG